MDDAAVFSVAALACAAIGTGVYIYLHRRIPAEEQERRRRTAINAGGRMVDAAVLDVQDGVVLYTYEVRGVAYTAAQDLKGLPGAPEDPALLLGVATAKYLPKDPASSIVFCESWSGLRPGAPHAPAIDSMEKES